MRLRGGHATNVGGHDINAVPMETAIQVAVPRSTHIATWASAFAEATPAPDDKQMSIG